VSNFHHFSDKTWRKERFWSSRENRCRNIRESKRGKY